MSGKVSPTLSFAIAAEHIGHHCRVRRRAIWRDTVQSSRAEPPGSARPPARALHERGAEVTIADVNAEKGEALASGARGARDLCALRRHGRGSRRRLPRAAQSAGELRVSVCCAGVGWAERTASKRGPHQLMPFETVCGST